MLPNPILDWANIKTRTTSLVLVIAITAHCKGVTVLETPTNGGIQHVKFISEPEVYRLIFKSNAPNAEVFNSWLAEEVLPSIHKTGSYSIANLSRKELAMMVIQAEEECVWN